MGVFIQFIKQNAQIFKLQTDKSLFAKDLRHLKRRHTLWRQPQTKNGISEKKKKLYVLLHLCTTT
jgi:hypothetical protein